MLSESNLGLTHLAGMSLGSVHPHVRIGQDEDLGQYWEYWVDFRNIELDTEADHVDKTPLSDLSSALDLAELAVNQLGRTMQVVEARERLSLDDMLNELDAKLNAALNED